MKPNLPLAILSVSLCAAQAQVTPPDPGSPPLAPPPPGGYTLPAPLTWPVTAQDWNTITREFSESVTNALTGEVTVRPHKVTQMGVGLNYLDASAVWQPSQDLIELTADGGAAALHGPYKVSWSAAGLNSDAALTIITASNRVFQARVLGVFYFDPASGQSKLLAAPSDAAVGELLPPNQIVYRSAFNSDLLKADLRYTYTKSGFESEVILTAQPKLSPADCGFDPASAWLQVRHQWAAPVIPQIRTITDGPGPSDQLLDFGELWFPRGRAFAVDGGSARPTNLAASVTVANPASGDVPVGKEWQQGAPSSTLLESVLWTSIAPKLSALPLMASRGGPTATNLVASGGSASTPPKAQASASRPIRLASAPYRRPGLVLDWTTIQGPYGDFTFQAYDPNQDNSYYVPGAGAYFSGTVTFGQGCIIQFQSQSGGYLLLYGGIVCNGNRGWPSYLTSDQDQRFFSGSQQYEQPYRTWPNLPPIGAASTALQLYYIPTNVTVQGMSISFATTAIEFDSINSSLTETVSDTALFDCQTGVYDRKNCCNITILNSAAYQVATETDSECGGNPFAGGFSQGYPPAPVTPACVSAQLGANQLYFPDLPPTLVDWWLGPSAYALAWAGTGLSFSLSIPQYGAYPVWVNARNPFGASGYPPSLADAVNAPDSFESTLLTDFLETTNGMTSSLWTAVPHHNPPQPREMQWNNKALVYGRTGFTAISQLTSWSGWDPNSATWAVGLAPATAISARHAILPGDSFHPFGLNNTINGYPIWFVTADNDLVTAYIAGQPNVDPPAANVVGVGANYFTIVIFSQDLPTSITPMAVGAVPLDTTVFLQTCRTSPGPNAGGVAACGPFASGPANPPTCPPAPPFYLPTGIPGDSGSPTMLPVDDPTEGPILVLYGLMNGGFTTNGLQSYMDDLSDRQGFRHYPLQIYTGYPTK